jgi:DNA-binding MarR family transcriptional regulator
VTRSTKGASGALTDDLDFLIRDTRLRLYKSIEGRIAKQRIPLRIWFPLRALYTNDGITQRELGRMLGFGDARAGVVVGVMLRHRLVVRQASRIDRRRINLYLTPAGKKMARQALKHRRSIEAQITAGFTAADIDAMKTLLLRIRANLAAR